MSRTRPEYQMGNPVGDDDGRWESLTASRTTHKTCAPYDLSLARG